jgi:hypothetical protein
MKTILIAALAAAALSCSDVVAQNSRPTVPQPSARNSINEQLDAIGARIDRRLARGRLSKNDAAQAHQEVDDIQAEASEDRLHDGGQLSETDRFAIVARIHQLEARIEGERTPVPDASSRP